MDRIYPQRPLPLRRVSYRRDGETSRRHCSLSIQVRTVIFDRSSSRGCPFDVRGIDEHDTTEMAGGIKVETPPAVPPSGPCALTTSINISLIPGELDSASLISRDRPGSSRSAIDIRRFNLFRGSSTGRAQGYYELSRVDGPALLRRYCSIDLSGLVRDYERILARLAGHHARGPGAPSRSGDGCRGYCAAQLGGRPDRGF